MSSGEPGAAADPLLATVVTGARRRALRDGDRQIDTAHLLHALVESDPDCRAAFDGRQRVARVLGYLVQRSIGYGLRWQGTAELGGDRRALPALLATEPSPRTGPGAPGAPGAGRVSGWSPAAAAALEEAVRRAAARGAGQPCGLDLLAAVAADPGSRAAEVLRRAGADPSALAERAARLVEERRTLPAEAPVPLSREG